MKRRAGALTLGPAERARLIEGARRFEVVLDDGAVARFARYAQLLDQWSARMNLISCRTPTELVDRHLLDSLAPSPHLAGARTIVDLGSGAGLPGVPLAIGDPGRRVQLVEPRRRRASFLREVKRALALVNVEVLERRAEATSLTGGGTRGAEAGAVLAAPTAAADAVVTRAVWSDETVLLVAARWLRPNGVLLWMRAAGDALSAPTPNDHPPPQAGVLQAPRRIERMSLRARVEYRIEPKRPRVIEIYARECFT